MPSTRKAIIPAENKSSSLSSAAATTAASSPAMRYSNYETGGGGAALSGRDYLDAARTISESSTQIEPSPLGLAPRSQSVAAVAEEEWEKRGIGFKTRAEMGTGWHTPETIASGQQMVGGSSLLTDLIAQTLIHDQYDRAVMEQDREIQAKMDKAMVNAKKKGAEE